MRTSTMTRLPVIAALLSAGALLPAPAFAQYDWRDDQVTGGGNTSTAPASTSPYGADPGGQGYEDGEGDSYGGGDASRPSGAPTANPRPRAMTMAQSMLHRHSIINMPPDSV